MISAVMFGVLFGLATATYLTILWSAVRAKGVVAGLIAVALVLVQVAVAILDVPWAPYPTRVAESMGVSVDGDTRLPMFLTLFMVAGGGFALAQLSGVVRRISHWIDALVPGDPATGDD